MLKKLDYVTNGHLAKVLEEYRIGILREVRLIAYEAMKNTEVHFDEEVKRYTGASQEEFQDKMLKYEDGLKMMVDKQIDYEDRLIQLEANKYRK